MTLVNGITRRDFLKAGTLATAGLLIGFRLPGSPAEAAPAGVAFEPNAWLRVDPDGSVTVTVARSEMGQGVRTSLPMLVAEELEVDWSRVRFEQAVPAPKYGNMSTGGSQSIRTSFEPLRRAGAAAREMLVAAAAQAWNVDPASCRAKDGEVVHEATKRRAAYGALAARAGKLPVPEKPKLREPKEWNVLGTSRPRLDTPSKVDGSAKFGIDVRLDGMLTACVARCPVFGGKAASHDPAKALAVPGVRHVVPIASGIAVVADSYWTARQGVEALVVKWDEGPLATLDSEAISKTYAELIRKPAPVVRKDGEGAAALARAARKLEAVYETPYLAHATMEPMNCTAWVRDGKCDVWTGSQNGTSAQRAAAKVAGVAPDRVTVHLQYLGGGFGRRSETDFVEEAVEIAKALGVPVRVVWSREDDMQHDWYRPATAHLLQAGLDAAGAPLVWTHRMTGPAILQRWYAQGVQNGIDPTSVDCAEQLPYGFPHLQVEYALHDPGIPTGWWRSVAASQNVYAIECFMDEIAAAAGRDPVEFRRALLEDRPQHLAVLDAAAGRANWGSPLPAGRGRGIAVAEAFDSFVAQVAEVEVAADGRVRVHRVVCAIDCGTVMNPDTVVAQMESGIVFGLSATLFGEVPIRRGRAAVSHFNDYPVLTMAQCPVIETHLVPSGSKLGGIGEVGLPPIAPAVVNAIAAATGRRLRKLPVKAAELKRG
jgi:isoquinoline 1-oxidoreductase beta subunit